MAHLLGWGRQEEFGNAARVEHETFALCAWKRERETGSSERMRVFLHFTMSWAEVVYASSSRRRSARKANLANCWIKAKPPNHASSKAPSKCAWRGSSWTHPWGQKCQSRASGAGTSSPLTPLQLGTGQAPSVKTMYKKQISRMLYNKCCPVQSGVLFSTYMGIKAMKKGVHRSCLLQQGLPGAAVATDCSQCQSTSRHKK